MKLRELSLGLVAVAVHVLVLLNWAGLQFVVLPNMSEDQRKHLYSGFASTPYPYIIGITFVCFAIWFVFSYRGPLMTEGRKTAVFGIALATICGMLLILAIRIAWHI